MERRDIAQKLYEARKMHTPEEVDSFEEARVALYNTGDPSILSDLFAAFDDATEQHEVMWGLIHDAEGFGLETYVRAMAQSLPEMLQGAEDWATILHERIFNSKKAMQIYRRIIPDLPEETREIITKFLEGVARAKPKFSKHIEYILRKRSRI